MGLSKLSSTAGQESLYKHMKGLYGSSRKWADLLRMDAVLLKNTKTALGYDGGNIYLFQAARDETNGGWTLTLEPTDIYTNEERNLLAAHASLEERIRAHGNQAASYACSLQRAQEEIKQLKEKLNYAETLNNFQSKEIRTLREAYLKSNTLVQETTVTVRSLSKTPWILLGAMLLLFWITPARAEDCSLATLGCYVDQRATGGQELSYREFTHICYGVTTTVLRPEQVNRTRLHNECIDALLGHVDNEAYAQAWCEKSIQERLRYVNCEKYTTFSVLKAYLENFDFSIDYIQNLEHAVVFFSIAMLLFTDRPLYGIGIYICGLILNVPPFMLTIAVTTFPVYTLVAILMALFFTQNIAIMLGVFFAHWVFGTLYTYVIGEGLAHISNHLAMSLLAPTWFAVLQIVQYYQIKHFVQLLTFVVAITWSVGINFLNSQVTVVSSTGEVKKQKRFEILKNSARNTLLKVQNAVRGVVPAIPDKADSVVMIEITLGTGVGFRFMNNILTIGHLVGTDKTVKITWKQVTVVAKVEQQIPLFESSDTLVKIKLPKELNAIKPLRLTRKVQSDYMALICFENDQVSQFSGWAAVDGNWISTSFDTHPGTSGAPYLDRNGRLVGIHLGTQGVVAQGYVLYNTLHGMPPVEQQCDLRFAPPAVDVADEILRKVIEGTKISHAALTSEVEKLVDVVMHLNKVVTALETRINDHNYRLQTLEEPLVAFEKKKGKNKNAIKAKFNKIKVLTEDQYQQMMDEGWSAEDINEAVQNLREQAWVNYQIDMEEDEETLLENLNKDFILYVQSKPHYTMENGKRTQTVEQVVIQQLKSIVVEQKKKRKPYTCGYCKQQFTTFHDRNQCKKQQAEKKKPLEEQSDPKNGEKGEIPPQKI
ncbi:nsp1a [Passerine astrovirus 3]|nr:nsp1a [Passerine astrovirus 3]